jgi:hypothetical protein
MRVGLGAKGGGDDSGKGHRGETSGGGSGCQWDGGTGGGWFWAWVRFKDLAQEGTQIAGAIGTG